MNFYCWKSLDAKNIYAEIHEIQRKILTLRNEKIINDIKYDFIIPKLKLSISIDFTDFNYI